MTRYKSNRREATGRPLQIYIKFCCVKLIHTLSQFSTLSDRTYRDQGLASTQIIANRYSIARLSRMHASIATSNSVLTPCSLLSVLTVHVHVTLIVPVITARYHQATSSHKPGLTQQSQGRTQRGDWGGFSHTRYYKILQ